MHVDTTAYFYFAPGGVQSIVMIMFVCLSVCLSVSICPSVPSHSSKTTWRNFTIFVHVACGSDSVVLWRRCDTVSVCISSFVDDVFFIPWGQRAGIKRDIVFRRSSPRDSTGMTSRQLQRFVQFIILQPWVRSLLSTIDLFQLCVCAFSLTWYADGTSSYSSSPRRSWADI